MTSKVKRELIDTIVGIRLGNFKKMTIHQKVFADKPEIIYKFGFSAITADKTGSMQNIIFKWFSSPWRANAARPD